MIFLSTRAASGRGRRRSAYAGTVAVATAVLLGMAATAQAATGFQVQASSNVSGSDFDELNGVTSANNWAVGSDANHSLIEHQNNSSSWSLVSSPANEPVNSVLEAVSATSANDIWAVGDSGPAPSSRASSH
jgi:hypothetical protein